MITLVNIRWRPVLAGLILLAVGGCGGVNPTNAFVHGEKSFARKQYEKARDAFNMALTREELSDLRRAEIHNYLGLIASLQGRVEDAEEHFTQARAFEPQFFDPVYNLGLTRLERGDATAAESILAEAADLESGQAYALEWRAHLELRRGNLTDARRLYSESMSLAGSSPRILTALANVEWAESGKPGDALTYLMQALEMNPNYAPALFNVARIYDLSLDRDEARAYYQQYLEVAQDARRIEFSRARMSGREVEQNKTALEAPAPEEKRTSAEELESMVASMLTRAEERNQAGLDGQALNFCLQAAARARAVPELRERALQKAVELCFDSGRSHYELGRFLEEQNRLPEALARYKQAAALEKNTKYIHVDLADLAARMNEDDAALSSLRAAVEIDSNDPEVRWKLAVLLDELGMKEKAAQAYTRFTGQFPDDPRGVKAAERLKSLNPAPVDEVSLRSDTAVLTAPAGSKPADQDNALKAYNRGTAYLQAGDLDRAVYFYKRAIELDASLVTAYYNLGLTYRQKGDLSEAADMFSASRNLNPDMVDAYYNLALVLHDLKRDQEAINALKTLTRKQVDYIPAYYLAGVIFSKYPEQRSLARRYYTQFTQLADPNDPYLPAARRWLAENP